MDNLLTSVHDIHNICYIPVERIRLDTIPDTTTGDAPSHNVPQYTSTQKYIAIGFQLADLPDRLITDFLNVPNLLITLSRSTDPKSIDAAYVIKLPKAIKITDQPQYTQAGRNIKGELVRKYLRDLFKIEMTFPVISLREALFFRRLQIALDTGTLITGYSAKDISEPVGVVGIQNYINVYVNITPVVNNSYHGDVIGSTKASSPTSVPEPSNYMLLWDTTTPVSKKNKAFGNGSMITNENYYASSALRLSSMPTMFNYPQTVSSIIRKMTEYAYPRKCYIGNLTYNFENSIAATMTDEIYKKLLTENDFEWDLRMANPHLPVKNAQPKYITNFNLSFIEV